MIPKGFSLEGRVAIVTGTGGGWLGALASYLAEAGADVTLAAQDEKQIEAAAQEIKKWGRRVLAIPTDVTHYQSIDAMVAEVIARWGRIDILVNNMDLLLAKPLLEVAEEEWHQVITTNLTAVFLCTKAVGKHMMERKEGSVINISSIFAERGLPNSTAYCASKGGVGQLTKALALEWARDNIRVNAIGVGWVSEAAEGESRGSLERYISLSRFSQPEDIGALLVFLASDASSYATGQTYFVSGGVMAHG
jgi:NAD(P)-dependent dehydrogenase (short-subunit alcohol dehydrogenase family)